MKFKTTSKAIKERYSNIISIGYADAQTLLNVGGLSPLAYNATCSWNYDMYDIRNADGIATALITGYRPFKAKKIDYEILDTCEKYLNELQYACGIDTRKSIAIELLKGLCCMGA